jgi:flagellar hook assembly protein FlgD
VLKQNYPNPFNPGTMIGFEVPADGPVNLAVYNVLGQKVRTLVDQRDYVVGRYELEWDGCDDSGTRVSTGVYFYRLTAGDQSLTKKMLLLK